MKIPDVDKLTDAYLELYPEELYNGRGEEAREEHKYILQNYLDAYVKEPGNRVATVGWRGKVTKAMFKALGIKQPKTKREMLIVLETVKEI